MAYDSTTGLFSDGGPALAAAQLNDVPRARRLLSLDGDASATLVTPTGNTYARSLADRAADFRWAADFLLRGQSVSDLISGQIDASGALARMAAANVAQLPGGPGVRFRCDAPIGALASGCALLGMHEGGTRIDINFATGDLITLPYGTDEAAVERLTVTTRVSRTSGAVVRVAGATNSTVRRLAANSSAATPLFDVVVVGKDSVSGASSTITRLSSIKVSDIANDAIRVEGYAIETFMDECSIAGAGNGLHLKSGSGVYPHRVSILACTNVGVLVDPSNAAGDNVNGVFLDTVLSDTNTNHAWLLGGDGPITEFRADKCWGSASGTTGQFTSGQAITIAAGGLVLTNLLIDGAEFHGFISHANGGYGALLDKYNNVKFIGGTFYCNGQVYTGSGSTTTRYAGILDTGFGDNAQLIGVASGNGGIDKLFNGGNKQSYGLFRSASGPGNKTFTVVGGNYSGNVTAGKLIGQASGDVIYESGE